MSEQERFLETQVNMLRAKVDGLGKALNEAKEEHRKDVDDLNDKIERLAHSTGYKL